MQRRITTSQPPRIIHHPRRIPGRHTRINRPHNTGMLHSNPEPPATPHEYGPHPTTPNDADFPSFACMPNRRKITEPARWVPPQVQAARVIHGTPHRHCWETTPATQPHQNRNPTPTRIAPRQTLRQRLLPCRSPHQPVRETMQPIPRQPKRRPPISNPPQPVKPGLPQQPTFCADSGDTSTIAAKCPHTVAARSSASQPRRVWSLVFKSLSVMILARRPARSIHSPQTSATPEKRCCRVASRS